MRSYHFSVALAMKCLAGMAPCQRRPGVVGRLWKMILHGKETCWEKNTFQMKMTLRGKMIWHAEGKFLRMDHNYWWFWDASRVQTFCSYIHPYFKSTRENISQTAYITTVADTRGVIWRGPRGRAAMGLEHSLTPTQNMWLPWIKNCFGNYQLLGKRVCEYFAVLRCEDCD